MINSLLAIVPNYEDGNWYFDNIGEAVVYALLGFLVVVLGITIIIGIIWLVGFILKKTNNLAFLTKGKVKKDEETKPQAQVNVDEAENDEIPDAVKAAIVAALMAYYEQEQPQCEFTVKRIKRI